MYNLTEQLFYILYCVWLIVIKIPTIYSEPYTPLRMSLWDFTTANGSKERGCFTFIVFTCRWEAECSGYGVIHYWPTEWMWTMCLSERSGSTVELHDWPLGEKTALPPIYLRNAGGIWQDCCLQMMDGIKSWISSAINHIIMENTIPVQIQLYLYHFSWRISIQVQNNNWKAAFSTFYWSYWKQLNPSGQFTISHKWTENRPCTLDSLCRNDVWCFCSLCVLWCIGSQQVKLYARTL